MELLYDIFQISVLIYSIMILLCISAQVLMARQNLRNNKWKYTDLDLTTLKNSPLAPGISIVAPAYNEQTTIISNVNSLPPWTILSMRWLSSMMGARTGHWSY